MIDFCGFIGAEKSRMEVSKIMVESTDEESGERRKNTPSSDTSKTLYFNLNLKFSDLCYERSLVIH